MRKKITKEDVRKARIACLVSFLAIIVSCAIIWFLEKVLKVNGEQLGGIFCMLAVLVVAPAAYVFVCTVESIFYISGE